MLIMLGRSEDCPIFAQGGIGMEGFPETMRRWLKKVKDLPLFGSMAEDLMTLIDLLSDYSRGVYKNLPRGVLIAAVVGLGYALCPIDLILDIIPFAGYLDDAAILFLLLDFFIARDILRYRRWKTELQGKGLLALRENQSAEIRQQIGNLCLAAAYLTENKQIRLLLCDPGEDKVPLRCRSVLADIAADQLKALGVDTWEDIGSFYSDVFRDPRINWSKLGQRPFMPEYDPQAKTDDFVIN